MYMYMYMHVFEVLAQVNRILNVDGFHLLCSVCLCRSLYLSMSLSRFLSDSVSIKFQGHDEISIFGDRLQHCAWL